MSSEERLADRIDVIEAIYREMSAIDAKNWPALLACFSDEIELDLTGAPFGPNKPIKLTAGKWVEAVKQSMDRFTVTQHSSSNEIVEFSGASAICRSYICARHVYSNPQGGPLVYELWERLTHKLEKTANGWKISSFKADVCWEQNRPPD
jgi:ketosteroid isomerase-like protein